MQNINKYSSWILYGLMLITVICFGMFYFGGNVETADPEFPEPIFTGLVLNFAYITMAIGFVLTVVFALYQFAMQLKDHPKEAISTLITLGAFVLLLFISWTLGSGEPLNLPAYDGSDNVYFWLKLTDMWLYSAAFLLGASIVSIIVFSLIKVVRK
ncbi:MAG: hypothetical protein RR202_12975 [Bacteroidales bacterium]